MYPIEVQNEWLDKLIKTAQNTEFGKKHNFSKIKTYEDFKNYVPLQDYETLKPYILEIKKGKPDVLWPGEVKWFAKSSGTVNDKSKFIPITKESLQDCHYKGGKDLLGIYHHINPESKLILGKTLIVGGSSQINHFSSDSYYGDLSAIIIKNLPFWVENRRTPDINVALLDKWEEKIEQMAKLTSKENVTNISGVPSWTLLLLKRILELNKASNIDEVWPNLELYMHGGVNFEPYKNAFKMIIPNKKVTYLETYNASEGFFGIQDEPDKDEMLLMLDYGIFYEFIDVNESEPDNPKVVTLADVEKDKNYALVITTNGGLWRYQIGDTIRFTNLYPFKIKITGRTKLFINMFGEELVIENAEKAIVNACERTKSIINEFTIAPHFNETKSKGYHEWVIEFEKNPDDLNYFREILDNSLKNLNSDYEAKRYNNLLLQPPVIHTVKKGTFYNWMKQRNKLGGQNKVPRMFKDTTYVNQLIKMA
ncbi:MAG: GH3 auxin-responsive promoter family protein [Vicingaceae bacterium]